MSASIPAVAHAQASMQSQASASGAVTGLESLPRHTPATVVEVLQGKDANDQEVALRLLEIGFLPGEDVTVVAHGFPGGEPLAVRIGSTTFALRRHEAQLVRVHVGGASA